MQWQLSQGAQQRRIAGETRQRTAAEALGIVMFDCLRRKHEIADSEIGRERAGGPNADDRFHVVRVVE